ncbi:reverse transcriptase domain-containing protein [Tanacetum coccineum]
MGVFCYRKIPFGLKNARATYQSLVDKTFDRLWSINMKLNLKKCLSASKRVPRQVPIYFVSRVLQGVELNYPKLEKLILALVHVERRLQRYFQAYPIRVLTDKPIKQILARPKKLGRIAKWAIKLDEHDIKFKGRGSVKGEILDDFLDKVPSVKDRDTEIKKLEVKNKVPRMVRFVNDQFAPILGYGDLVQGNVTIKQVYFVEGLNHNLFSVGQYCNADLEVSFKNQRALLEIFRETIYSMVIVDLISIQMNYKNHLLLLQSVSWPKHHQVKRGYGIIVSLI